MWWSSLPSSRHFSLHSRLSSARVLQFLQVWAACSRSLGARKVSTYRASCKHGDKTQYLKRTAHQRGHISQTAERTAFVLTSLGRSDIKSLWNWGSMTCIMCFTWLVSHLLISSSRASSRSGPLHICVKRQRGETLAQDEETKIYIYCCH